MNDGWRQGPHGAMDMWWSVDPGASDEVTSENASPGVQREMVTRCAMPSSA